jgi:hypothetical protein
MTRSGLKSLFPPGEQKKLKGLTLNSLLLIPIEYAPSLSGPKRSAIAVVPETVNAFN